MNLKKLIYRDISLGLSDFLQGQSVKDKLLLLEESQWWKRSQIDSFQNERLLKLIVHSVDTVPYYNELFKKNKLTVTDIKSKDDLYKIPFLTKDEIRKHSPEHFVSKIYPNKKKILSASSGSTGEPLFYYNSKEAYSMNIAANIRAWKWMGFDLGDKYTKLSQNPRNNILKKIQDKITNNLYLATSPMIDSNFKHILEQIEEYRPKVIRCYPDPLLFLARYKKNTPSFTYVPLAITTTGNTLYPETRKEIEDAFGCEIFDSYSCEGNSNVSECETHDGYHSCEEYGISEILDDNNNSVVDGIGRLVSTDLWNFAQPFIRYETQDNIEVTSKKCSCSRELLRFKKILGRDSDYITNSYGQRFIVHSFTAFFTQFSPTLNQSVDSFQVVKESNSVTFNLIINDRFSSDIKDYVKSYWEDQFRCPVNICIVEDIPLTISGKRKFIINKEKV